MKYVTDREVLDWAKKKRQAAVERYRKAVDSKDDEEAKEAKSEIELYTIPATWLPIISRAVLLYLYKAANVKVVPVSTGTTDAPKVNFRLKMDMDLPAPLKGLLGIRDYQSFVNTIRKNRGISILISKLIWDMNHGLAVKEFKINTYRDMMRTQKEKHANTNLAMRMASYDPLAAYDLDDIYGNLHKEAIIKLKNPFDKIEKKDLERIRKTLFRVLRLLAYVLAWAIWWNAMGLPTININDIKRWYRSTKNNIRSVIVVEKDTTVHYPDIETLNGWQSTRPVKGLLPK